MKLERGNAAASPLEVSRSGQDGIGVVRKLLRNDDIEPLPGESAADTVVGPTESSPSGSGSFSMQHGTTLLTAGGLEMRSRILAERSEAVSDRKTGTELDRRQFASPRRGMRLRNTDELRGRSPGQLAA
jgi:hypothetical protein